MLIAYLIRMNQVDALAAEITARVQALPDKSAQPVRAVRREYSRAVRRWDARDVVELALALKREGEVHRFVGDELIANHRAALVSLTRADLEQLGEGMDTWDQVDCFAPYLAGPAWRAGQIGDEVIAAWARSSDRWWRRAALVSTTRLNVLGTKGDARRTLAVCDMLIADRDDMVVKAMSWALRALAIRDRDAVVRYAEANREKLAPRVVREVGNKLRTGLKTPRRAG